MTRRQKVGERERERESERERERERERDSDGIKRVMFLHNFPATGTRQMRKFSQYIGL